MNIDTLLEAAKYVESGGVVAAEQQFTRGRDEVDSRSKKRRKDDDVASPILQNRLSGSSPPKRRRSKSPQSSYMPQPQVSGPQHQVVSAPQQSTATIPNNNIPISSSIIQQTPRYTLPNQPPAPYHLYAQMPQQHIQHMQQNPPQHPYQPPHHHIQPPQHLPQPEQQHYVQSVNKSPKPPTSLPHQPQQPQQHSPHVPTSSPATPQHMVTPQQAIDLLQLAESQGNKYTTLTTATTSPRGGTHASPSNRHGNMSPRLVHQIVGHNPWAVGERPISPKSSPGFKPGGAGESDSADSGNDGSGKDKRAGIREVHNKLEKNRRAHLKECFENLQAVLPNMEDKKSKTSNLSILGGANRYIQVLKRKERELEHELDRLVRRKIESQQQLDLLKIKNGMSTSETVNLPPPEDRDDYDDRLVVVEDKDIEVVVDHKKIDDDDDQASTSTASEAEEEERKSQEQSRSQSPLHQPVSSHLGHPAYSHPDLPSAYHHGLPSLPSLHSPSKTGLSHSANEAMLRISAMKEAQASESSRQRHASEEIRSRHPSSGVMGHSPRTTYLQMGADKVSTVLQNVASQISPTSKKETVLVSQSTSAMAGSISRQTVSQLLGKQPMVRQPVRRQLPVSQMPVIQPPMRTSHILPRIMSTPPVRFGFTANPQGVINTTKPVVTVGINSLLAQPSVVHSASMHKTVISNGLVTTAAANLTSADLISKHNMPVLTTPAPLTTPALSGPLPSSAIGTTDATVSKSLMTASVITQTLPVVTHTGPSPFISPIALQSQTNPGASLLLTHPASSYIGLQPSMITQPFIGSFPAAARPPHIQVATSTQVTPSSATAQPLVHPSVQPVGTLGTSAISLALAQAAIPKHIPQTLTTSFPSALAISSLTSNTLPPTTHITPHVSPHKQTTFGAATSAVSPPVSSTLAKPKAYSASMSSGSKGSRSKHGKSVNGKTELQITTSKIAETMANLASNAQTMAKNGHSTTTIKSSTTQQSVVVKL